MPAELLHLSGDGETYVTAEVVRRGMRVRFSPGATVRHFTSASRMTLNYLRERSFKQGVIKTYTIIRKLQGFNPRVVIILTMIIIKSLVIGFLASNPGIRAMRFGYIKGIVWHLQHCGSIPDTIEWILKDKYIK